MATSRTTKARAEVEKARQKLAEQQTKLKELEAKKTEVENLDIVDIVRGMNIPLDDLADVLQSLKNAAIPAASTSGQVDPKSKTPKLIKGGIDESDAGEEDNEE